MRGIHFSSPNTHAITATYSPRAPSPSGMPRIRLRRSASMPP
ncbi:uncharacterized protein AruCF_1119 [Achromobacter ruhlandii]|nr:uncharacterized protein AruCF_1119 [Achromobacter ruhlandii]